MTIELIMVIVVCGAAVAAIASLCSIVVVTLSNKAAAEQARYADKIAAEKVLALAATVAKDLALDVQGHKAAEKVLALAAKVAADLVKETDRNR